MFCENQRNVFFLNSNFQGELGTYIKSPWRDLVDANATVGDIYKQWKKGMKHNTQYSWKQFKDYQPFTGARTAQRRFDNAEPGKEASKIFVKLNFRSFCLPKNFVKFNFTSFFTYIHI